MLILRFRSYSIQIYFTNVQNHFTLIKKFQQRSNIGYTVINARLDKNLEASFASIFSIIRLHSEFPKSK
jgi:hypothetical protein